MKGKLYVYVGPMASGKTTRMLDASLKYHLLTNNIPLFINHANDTREELYSTHCLSRKNSKLSENHIDFVSSNELSSIDVTKYNVICIDEAQFFPDLKSQIKLWLKQDKIIYVAGLDGDSNMETFGQVTDLCPLADEFIKLSAICKYCYLADLNDFTPAPFTYYNGADSKDSQVKIGGLDLYVPTCRMHHYNRN